MKKIAVFASGSGSNAQKIYEYFNKQGTARISHLIVNNSKAGVIEKSQKWGCKNLIINRVNFYESANISDLLQKEGVDLVVLAGFLWLIPDHLLNAFPNKIINIHPALLPNYGGKGMYGMNVHRAVFEKKEKESGITIHTIDEEYDRGEVLYQEAINIENCASPEEVGQAVLKLEHANFPRVIEEYLTK